MDGDDGNSFISLLLAKPLRFFSIDIDSFEKGRPYINETGVVWTIYFHVTDIDIRWNKKHLLSSFLKETDYFIFYYIRKNGG